MNKLPAPPPTSPTPPRKTRRRSDLSFEVLASIDLISLLDQAPCDGQPACPDDDGEPVLPLDDAPLSPPSDDPIAWSLEPPFYSTTEAANWLSVSAATVKRLLSGGSLPFPSLRPRRRAAQNSPFGPARLRHLHPR